MVSQESEVCTTGRRTKSQIAIRTLAIALMMAITTETMAEMTASMPWAMEEMMEPWGHGQLCRLTAQERMPVP
jgi:Spy/CpxP family protein refolding chaperone